MHDYVFYLLAFYEFIRMLHGLHSKAYHQFITRNMPGSAFTDFLKRGNVNVPAVSIILKKSVIAALFRRAVSRIFVVLFCRTSAFSMSCRTSSLFKRPLQCFLSAAGFNVFLFLTCYALLSSDMSY